MTVTLARTAGFCAGVASAVNTVYREMDKHKLVTLGPLIHNRSVTDDLAQKGVRIINNVDEVQPGETVVIRSHGVPPQIEEELRRRGIPYIDCTCENVKCIHRHAANAKAEGRILIIAGKESHPEIQGIIGYAVRSDSSDAPQAVSKSNGSGIIIISGENDEQLNRLDPSKQYTLVAQTTFECKRLEQIIMKLKELDLDVKINETICDATGKRQSETEALAGRVDVMLVLGDINSANTCRLYEIAKKKCKKTYLLASIRELQLQFLNANDKIGITAGASTPALITKEAIHFMSDIVNTVQETQDEMLVQPEAQVEIEAQDQAAAQPEPAPVSAPAPAATQSFEEMLNESFVPLHTGNIVKSTVISVSNSEVIVNLGYKSDGIITRSEMTDDATADITQMVKPGDEIDVYVLRVNDGDGNVQVSKKRLDNQTNYKTIEQAFNDKTPIAGKVTDVVKGGLIAMVLGCRVFVPSSQISNRYVEDLTVFKGKEFNFNILEYDRSKRRIVAGRKELAAIEQQQRREELYATLEIGQRLEGTVSRIVEFGAFIDLGGVDGLVHISELAWKRVRKVTDVLQVGDNVVVTVIDINPEKNKISLSLKDISNNPWNNVAERYPIGSIIEGKVVRMASFGAFVTLEDGVDGLVHISQIADRHVNKPEDELTVGQIIQVKVTDIDEANHKISLSKREADVELGIYDDEATVPDVDDEAVPEEMQEEPAPTDGEDFSEANEAEA